MQDRKESYPLTEEDEALILQIVNELGATDEAKELEGYKIKLEQAEQKIAHLTSQLQELKDGQIQENNLSHHQQRFDLVMKLNEAEQENQLLRLEVKRLKVTLESRVEEKEESILESVGVSSAGVSTLRRRHVGEKKVESKSTFFQPEGSVDACDGEEREAMKCYRPSCLSSEPCVIL